MIVALHESALRARAPTPGQQGCAILRPTAVTYQNEAHEHRLTECRCTDDGVGVSKPAESALPQAALSFHSASATATGPRGNHAHAAERLGIENAFSNKGPLPSERGGHDLTSFRERFSKQQDS